MYCEITSNGKFAIQDMTPEELELFQEGLIVLKAERLVDPELFRSEREKCIEMHQKIDAELIRSRMPA